MFIARIEILSETLSNVSYSSFIPHLNVVSSQLVELISQLDPESDLFENLFELVLLVNISFLFYLSIQQGFLMHYIDIIVDEEYFGESYQAWNSATCSWDTVIPLK
ncbi:hypothetical protein AYI68_g3328 [Smittium mucronatum]|uniref:Uncharacterized protein n=1 Tax=Smittium mucronatum TaxID=133383 RepID=A0A1R0H079_9FUNG|nr:hypothetical protein AYI68_g3328 [Smittium mucronatum]